MFEIIKTKNNVNNAIYDLELRLQYSIPVFNKKFFFVLLVNLNRIHVKVSFKIYASFSFIFRRTPPLALILLGKEINNVFKIKY